MLESIDIEKEFDLDRRQFSRNMEMSYFSEKYNLAGTFDGNLIWSPESFAPRSGMVNLTAGLFGHSFNFLEVGGRAEGTGELLESYFGPSGFFTKDKAATPAPEQASPNEINRNKLNLMDERVRVHSIKYNMSFEPVS